MIEKADQYNGEADRAYGESDLQGLHARLYPEGAGKSMHTNCAVVDGALSGLWY
jgi:hypothetical protein